MSSTSADSTSAQSSQWLCPRCRVNLATVEYEYAVVETCPSCEGEWCDRLELLQITKTLEEKFDAKAIEAVRGIDDVVITAQRDLPCDLRCPKCDDVQLVPFNYGGTSGLVLDKCPSCEGIWLDRDELEHAQILVEEWEKRLEADLAEHKGALQTMRDEFAHKLGGSWASGPVGRFLGYHALMRRYERMTL